MTSPVVDKDRIAGSIQIVSGEDCTVHSVSSVEGNSPLVESKKVAKVEVTGYITINTGTTFRYDVINEYAKNTHTVDSCFVTNGNEVNCSVYAVPKNGKVTFFIKSLTDEPLNMGYVKLYAILK